MQSWCRVAGSLACALALAGCGGGGSGAAGAGDRAGTVAAAEPVAAPAPAVAGPAGAAPLAAAFDFAAAGTDEARMQRMAGSYTVAITAAPDAAAIGLGTLVVGYAGADGPVVIELRDATGTRLWSLSAPALSDRSVADGRGISLWDTAVEAGFRPAFSDGSLTGRRLGIYNYFEGGNTAGPEAYAQVSFVGPGYLVGSIGGYRFRNSVQYVGTAAPPALAALQGHYLAAAEALTCAPNPIDITIAADGIRVRGKSSVSCAAQDVQATWDGQDDFIFTDGAGMVSLVIDARHIGGAQPGGGIFATVPAAAAPASFGPLSVNFAGAAGGITALSPVRQ